MPQSEGSTSGAGSDLPPVQKQTHFIFSSKKNLRKFPAEARRDVGHNIDRVQRGLAPQNFDALRGVGSGVMEIKVDAHGDTYRAVYVAKFDEAVYILDCFQKKSPSGKSLPKNIAERLKSRYDFVKKHRPAKR